MMKLKAVVSYLLFAFADVIFRLKASPLVVQKFTIKIDIDPQIGDDFQKGPPGIRIVDWRIRMPQIELSQMMEQVATSSHPCKWRTAVQRNSQMTLKTG